MMRPPASWGTVLLVVLLSSLPGTSHVASQGRVKVTVTIASLEQFVLAVGGDRVEVSSMVPPSVDPHDVTLSPGMVDSALGSDLVVSSGHVAWELQLEELLSERRQVPFAQIGIDLYRDLGPRLLLLPVPGGAGLNVHGYWLLPSNALVIATAIEARLEGIDPADAASYRSNLGHFYQRVSQLSDLIASVSKGRGFAGEGVATASYEEQYVAYAFGLNASLVLVGEEAEIKPSVLDEARRGFEDGSIKAILVSDVVEQLPVFQSLKVLSEGEGVPIALVTVFEMSQLPDYVDMMTFNLGSVASSQGRPSGGGLDQATYLYAIALLAFLSVVEGAALYSRWRRHG
jgi:ABC-type Zn uptake system ZnuABC Zn-binding protein ZnuA